MTTGTTQTSSNGIEVPPIHTVETSVLSIAYHDSRPSDSASSNLSNDPPIILLHGFPYAPSQFFAVLQHLPSQTRVLIPYLRGYGTTKYLSKSTLRSGQQEVLAKDVLDYMDALSIPSAILAGYDWGGRAACVVAALHPTRCAGLLTCQGYGIQAVARDASAAPKDAAGVEQLRRYWYQFYFNTLQGITGLRANRGAVCRFLWETWSPTWKFTEQEWAETQSVFEEAGDDFVDTVIHSYRVRYNNVPGDPDPTIQEMEKRCAECPRISVPTVVLRGTNDGVHPCEADGSDGHKNMFTGWYERRNLDGVGHCPPAEAPKEFAEGLLRLLDVAKGESK